MSADLEFASMPFSERAQWLPPSQWPKGSEFLFIPRPFDLSGNLPVISRYNAVMAVLQDRDGWSRQVPTTVLPRPPGTAPCTPHGVPTEPSTRCCEGR